ncbi:MAG: hypothetical protein JWN78_45 [Bacteroidota bacterium]|nr:hypothetical protein [Bacteroidota bacterium]
MNVMYCPRPFVVGFLFYYYFNIIISLLPFSDFRFAHDLINFAG